MMRLKNEAAEKIAKIKARTVSNTIQDLNLIGASGDPNWHFLMGTIQDKRHFYKAAFSKISNDAMNTLKYVDTRKSPTFVKPPDKVNESSMFAEVKLNAYERMKEQLEKSQLPDNLEVLLQNKLGTYLNEMIKREPLKMVSKPTKEREARWAENDPKYTRLNKTLDYIEEQICIEKIVFKKA